MFVRKKDYIELIGRIEKLERINKYAKDDKTVIVSCYKVNMDGDECSREIDKEYANMELQFSKLGTSVLSSKRYVTYIYKDRKEYKIDGLLLKNETSWISIEENDETLRLNYSNSHSCVLIFLDTETFRIIRE